MGADRAAPEIMPMKRHYGNVTKLQIDEIVRRVDAGDPAYKIALDLDLSDGSVCYYYRTRARRPMPGARKRKDHICDVKLWEIQLNDAGLLERWRKCYDNAKDAWHGTPSELKEFLKILDSERAA